MMTDELKIGVIGTGMIGQDHIRRITGFKAKKRRRIGFAALHQHALAALVHAQRKGVRVATNYIIKQFNARVMGFYKDTRFDAVRQDFWQIGVGLQFQM